MPGKTTRIGLIGFGQIGKDVYRRIEANPQTGMQVVFVADKDPKPLVELPRELVLDDLNDFESRKPGLVVEMAHKDVARQWAPLILAKCDMMVVSVTAIADRHNEAMFKKLTSEHGTRLFLPHGGVVGMDSLIECRDALDSVHVVMKKNPMNVDTKMVNIDPQSITTKTVLYDGPARGACPKFPRNVNTIAAIAYASLGLDETRATLIVNPQWNTATVAVHATGPGLEMNIERIEQITGVTGATTPASMYNSIQAICNQEPGIHLR